MDKELYVATKNYLEKVFKKVLIERTSDYTSIIALMDDGEGIVLCIWDRRTHVYAKISSLSKTTFLECRDLLLQPYGLFIFARDKVEFMEKLRNKLKVIGYG